MCMFDLKYLQWGKMERKLRIDETERFHNIRRVKQHKDPYVNLIEDGKDWVEAFL